MPKVGLGTFRVENNDDCTKAVKYAIENGYRSIDTAKVYGNEEKVGQGIKEGLESTGLKREDLFITSKLWLEDFGRENVEQAYENSLKRLDLDYLDLYLMHWPGTNEALMIDTWQGMEDLYKQEPIKPVINQVEFHPYLTQKELRQYLDVQNIVMESWSPLMNAQILDDEIVNQVAQEVGQTPAQVIIRWNYQHQVVTIPKSVTPHRIDENLNILDFELNDDQMKKLDDLNQNKRIGPDPSEFNGQ